jgi:hypothetical protein
MNATRHSSLEQTRSIVVAVAALISSVPYAGTDMVWNANSDFDAGFSSGSNPNGVWTYGWSASLSSSLVDYTRNHVLTAGNGAFHAAREHALG